MLLVWTTSIGLDQNESSSQPKCKEVEFRSWNFSLDLRPKFWECTAFETLQFYWWKENFACWTPLNPIGSSSTSSCSFCFYLLWFWHDVSTTARWKLFDFVYYHQVPGVGQSTRWPNGSLTPNECQFPAAWKTTQISSVQWLCTLALQRTLQGHW